jgi:DNA-binding NtrC family response regulator
MRKNVLLADDDDRMGRLLEGALADWPGKSSLQITHCKDIESAQKKAENHSFQLAIVDLHFGEDATAGFRLIELLKQNNPSLEILALSSAGSFSAVQKAIRSGASDYVQKGFSPDEFIHAMERALERSRLRGIERAIVRDRRREKELIGGSKKMEELRSIIEKFSTKEAPLLVEGETGSGKELVAKALHSRSDRCSGPFVAVDCGAVPSSTADSFFFGHERGAFTGAERQRIGALEEAEGGTLFLDEVNSLAPELQNKLLRALQEWEIRRLGGNKTIAVDFRLICAANTSLESLVKEGKFREDLYYRIQVLRISVPPLRDRVSDLEELALAFFPKRKISPELWHLLKAYSWPGNVREFKNCLTTMDALAEMDEALSMAHLPERYLNRVALQFQAQEIQENDIGEFKNLQEQREQEFLARAYRSAEGNISKMSRMLNLDRSHLHQKLVKLGLHKAR